MTPNEQKQPDREAIALAKHLVESKAVVIDAETTDLYGEVIQIAGVCCNTLEVLFESYVKPSCQISEGAKAVHGIDDSMVSDAPTFDQVANDIKAVLGDKEWIAFNLPFDKNVMLNSRKDETDNKWITENTGSCAMYDLAVPILGATNRYGTISLANSAARFGIEFEGAAHDAAADALVTAKVVQAIAALDQ